MQAGNKQSSYYAGGIWRKPKQQVALYSPYDGSQIAEVAELSSIEAQEAIGLSQEAFPKYAATPAWKRAQVLYQTAEIIQHRQQELAQLIALETAKPIRYALGEIQRTIQTYRFSAEEAKRIEGKSIPMDAAQNGENRLAFTIKRPIGVVAAITPFNFPFNLVAHKVGPALAAGNTVLLKPAEQTPLSAIALLEILEEAGLQPGAVTLIPGRGDVVGTVLSRSKQVAKISFTGSPRVGELISNTCGLKRLTLELGSDSSVVVADDVEITQELVQRVVQGAFAFSGQVCISIQKIFVHKSLYTKFADTFLAQAAALKIGSPFDPTTDISAMISESSLQRVEEWLDEAVSQGANVLLGGKRHNSRIFPPTVLTDVPPSVRVFQEEVFAPVCCLQSYTDLAEVVEKINSSQYGLQTGIFSNLLQESLKFAEQVQVGGVHINEIPTFRLDHFPYGGVKLSGIGTEGVPYAVQQMLQEKLISVRL
ncbi:MAG: aldehyde dehydrogenase family protein [Spirochaetota bacterium]